MRGKVESLGADCIEKEMQRRAHQASCCAAARRAPASTATSKPAEFTRYGSARTLYNFHIDNADAY